MSQKIEFRGEDDELFVEAVLVFAEVMLLSEMVFQRRIIHVVLEQEALLIAKVAREVRGRHVLENLVVRVEPLVAEEAERMPFYQGLLVVRIADLEVPGELLLAVQLLIREEDLSVLHTELAAFKSVSERTFIYLFAYIANETKSKYYHRNLSCASLKCFSKRCFEEKAWAQTEHLKSRKDRMRSKISWFSV